MKNEIKKQSLAEVSVILSSIIKIAEYISDLCAKISKYREEKRQRKLYKEAEKALRSKNGKKISDFFRN